MGKEVTQFKKGQSGNPGGRPKSTEHIREVIKQMLSEPATEGSDKTRLHLILAKMANMAFNGNIKAAEVLFYYAYGKPGTMEGDQPDNNFTIVIQKQE